MCFISTRYVVSSGRDAIGRWGGDQFNSDHRGYMKRIRNFFPGKISFLPVLPCWRLCHGALHAKSCTPAPPPAWVAWWQAENNARGRFPGTNNGTLVWRRRDLCPGEAGQQFSFNCSNRLCPCCRTMSFPPNRPRQSWRAWFKLSAGRVILDKERSAYAPQGLGGLGCPRFMLATRMSISMC